jgi:hypothetical protein
MSECITGVTANAPNSFPDFPLYYKMPLAGCLVSSEACLTAAEKSKAHDFQ